MKMRFISTRSRAQEVAHEQGQMRFLSARTNANEVHKYKIKGKRGS